DNDMLLWFFSFTKLLMYRDLEPASWPESCPLAERPLLKALLRDGFTSSPPLVGEGQRIDAVIDPVHATHVIDCDSSQTLVIAEACAGRSLVIQGPPGTGKSQTITNLIASAVHAGKTILFVAEKMAALQVVQRRLAKIGLGDVCLELHSDLTKNTVVLQEIDRVLQLGRPKDPSQMDKSLAKLTQVRDELDKHVADMHTPLS